VKREFVDRVLAAARIDSPAPSKTEAAATSAILTPKEAQVLKLLAGGLPNKRIASSLSLSEETVKWHMKKLFTKLNAGSRQHAVDRARMLGLIS
jgi:LuxR family maltose regulon positive regulatory protein